MLWQPIDWRMEFLKALHFGIYAKSHYLYHLTGSESLPWLVDYNDRYRYKIISYFPGFLLYNLNFCSRHEHIAQTF